MKLTDLPNIGKAIAADLEKCGITTADELRQTGSKEAFIRIRIHADAGACLNKLCALEGALQGIPWNALPDETKSALKTFYKSL